MDTTVGCFCVVFNVLYISAHSRKKMAPYFKNIETFFFGVVNLDIFNSTVISWMSLQLPGQLCILVQGVYVLPFWVLTRTLPTVH